jgi:hypothetical protein
LGYTRAFREEEITKIELAGVITHFGDGAVAPYHVTLSLIGRFKQVYGEQQHCLPVAVTGSGVCIREWVDCFLKEKGAVGLVSGFMFLKQDGSHERAIDFEEDLVERLEWIELNTKGIIPRSINLADEFGVLRSMQWVSITMALNAGIDGPTIDDNNRWRKVEAAKAKMLR